jgi:hypothetical protein
MKPATKAALRREHFRSIEEYLEDRGWKKRSGGWRHSTNMLSVDNAAEALGVQLLLDSSKGWNLIGITLERAG